MTTERPQWRWIEGKVDPNREHFKLLSGDSGRLFNNKDVVNVNEVTADAGFEVVALVGRGRRNTFVVQFMMPDNAETHDALKRARRELDLYLIELTHEDISPWDYCIYHASSFGNFYSEIHWQYYPGRGEVGNDSTGNDGSS